MKRSQLALTPTLCERTKPAATKITLWDSNVLGLCLIVTPAGNRSFWFVARRDGKQIPVKIGEYHKPRSEESKATVWTVDAARDEAGRLRKLHDDGHDIRAHKAAQRNAKDFAALAADFRGSVGWRGMAKRTKQTYDGYLDNHILPLIGSRLVHDLAYADIVDMQKKIESKRNPPISVTAGFCVNLVGTMIVHAYVLGWRKRGGNPCQGVKTVDSTERTRIITADEYARINAAIGTGINAAVVRALAYSGMRVGEACAIQWRGVNLEAKTLSIYDHKTFKTMGVKTIPINEHLEEILTGQAGMLGPWVFRGLKGNHRQSVSVQGWWAKLMVELGIENLELHDFRRTFETTGVELGYPPGDMDVLVGHKLPGMQATYVHLSPGGILSQASGATAAWINAAMDAKKPRIGERVGAVAEKKA